MVLFGGIGLTRFAFVSHYLQDLQQQGSSSNKSKKKSANKGNSQASSSSSVTSCLCKFLFATFLLFGVTGALLGYDTYRAGGKFEASLTGQTLKQAGLLPAVQDGWTCTLKYGARGYKWAEANLPGYYQATCKVCTSYSMTLDCISNVNVRSCFFYSFLIVGPRTIRRIFDRI